MGQPSTDFNLKHQDTTKNMTKEVKIIKIFVASSDELSVERTALDTMVGHLNYSLNKIGMNIILVKWEFLDASMGPLHKQEEYNRELKECEICMVLYWTKFGMYTKTELDTAYNELIAGRNPHKLYVYFKDSEQPLTPELKEFQDSFPSLYGHFYCVFKNEDALKSHFLLQFIDYQNTQQKNSMSGLVEVKDAKVLVAGREYVDLNNVDFLGNNEEYHLLLQSIKKTKKLLAVTDVTDPEYSEYAQELQALIEKRQNMEESLWQTALTITRLSNEASSERLQHAIELFNKGDNRGANAILDETAIDRDINRNLQNIELGKAGLKNNIAELKLKIDILRNSLSDGWREQTEEIHKKIISLTEQVYGNYSEEHTDALSEAGLFYYDLGKYSEALCYLEKALEISLKIFGEKHRDVAAGYNNIGLIYGSLGNYDKALEFHKKSLDISLKIFGEEYSDVVATSYNNIGLAYEAQYQYAKALFFLEKSLNIQLKVLGEIHPNVAIAYNNCGTVYNKQGLFFKALKFYEKALNIQLSIFGEEHPDVATSYNNIGAIYLYLGNHVKTIEFYEKSLKILLKIYGMKHPDTATINNNIGYVYDSQGDYAKALEFYKKSLNIRLEIFGDKHPDLATSYSNIGNIYYFQKYYGKALECYEKALNISSKLLDNEHRDVIGIKESIEIVKRKLGNNGF